MRPVLHLLGQCEITLDGVPVPFQLTRKHWYVLGLVATAHNYLINRKELTDTVWPLSDEKSRSVLLHNWRRSLVTATANILPTVPVIISEDDVTFINKDIDVDYHECGRLAKMVLTSDDAQTVLDAGTAFDTLAEDKVLLPSFSSSFLELRERFDQQRIAVLRRTWQAEAHLQPSSKSVTSTFELRLRRLGDVHAIGTPLIPFQALPDVSHVPTRPSIVLSATSQLAASIVLGGIVAAPILLGSLNTPLKKQLQFIHGSKVDRPVTDLNSYVMFQVKDPGVKRSAATAINITPKDLIIAAGDASLTNGDHQTILASLTKSGKARWVSKRTDEKGIQTTPRQIFTSESGRIYIAAELNAEPNNARNLAPGRYLAVSVFDRDGQRMFERVHAEAIDGKSLHPIRLTSNHTGGIHAFAVSARGQASITMHIPAGPATEVAAPLTGFPKAFQLTDAVSDSKGHVFVLGHQPVKTSAGTRMDWHVQALDKASKTLWTRVIPGSIAQASVPIRGVINAMGDVVAYGPLPTPNKRYRGRKVASMVTMAAAGGAVIARECLDTEDQNPSFALFPLTIGNSAVIAVTKQTPDGDAPFSIHRFGIAATDTALTLSMRFPGEKRVEGIVSFYINKNGVVTALLQPSQEKSATTALTYARMFFGRGIETGDLSAAVPYGYNAAGGGLIAGHYANTFCVYDFSKLP